MTWQVVWEPAALDAAAGHLKDDPPSVEALLRATDRLAENERPDGSRAWGTRHRRLHYGTWRVPYRLDPEARTIHIEHVGRTGA
ncbi:type II toxin-antitoxin system RelE family toxin [Streptomyces triticisoli]|uniref:type II toxin-antitoxin system RelE family toxin n=1 Tax=Streptomyces triticisoli TaxID=2182797 RepID=UPI000DD7DE1B|nr:type II toxin-antitoxin system RelE/ParE family toxin [Streptomyces triticisoli]